MAAKTIIVDPEQLRVWANDIYNIAEDYQKNYQGIQLTVDNLANTWVGEDSTAYRNKAHEFDDDFQKMFNEINEYVNYLNTVAKMYDRVRTEAKARANALKGNYR